jgi:hypothetical protein
MNFPADDTGNVLAEMHKAGVDLTQMHAVTFFNLFEKKEQAQAMLTHLSEKFPDIICQVHPDETPNVWDLDCTVTMLPNYDGIVAQEAEFELLAGKFNGYNDGWGIEINE